ncbi:MAG: hypothetical protein Q9169_006517 [Polycauliona sp. 2 TL-2023]
MVNSRCQLRSQQRPSDHVTASDYPAIPRSIRFLHPCYREHKNLLFELLAPDNSARGLHHGTARIACAIIAGNRWDGFLSRTATAEKIDAGDEDLLTEDEYYFIVPGSSFTLALSKNMMLTVRYASGPLPSTVSQSDQQRPGLSTSANGEPYMYPVVPGFKEWVFPHRHLPAAWQQVDLEVNNGGQTSSDAIWIRDGSCRMTAYSEECDMSHLCPQSETEWYQENRMDQYRYNARKAGRQAINDACNMMLLRADLHRAWDKMRFVHVPKASMVGDSLEKMEFVTHVMNHSLNYGQLFHNTKLHTLGVARECLFARFAWTIFPLLSGFLQQGQARYLLRAEVGESECVDADECFQYGDSWKPVNQRGSRTPSPTKRSAEEAGFGERRFEMNAEDEVSIEATRTKRPRYDPRPSITHAHESTRIEASSKRTTPELVVPQSDSTKVSTSEGKEDRSRVALLYEAGLKAERVKSDPRGHWVQFYNKEQDWLEEVLRDGGAVDSREIPRLLQALGHDIIEDEQRL